MFCDGAIISREICENVLWQMKCDQFSFVTKLTSTCSSYSRGWRTFLYFSSWDRSVSVLIRERLSRSRDARTFLRMSDSRNSHNFCHLGFIRGNSPEEHSCHVITTSSADGQRPSSRLVLLPYPLSSIQ